MLKTFLMRVEGFCKISFIDLQCIFPDIESLCTILLTIYLDTDCTCVLINTDARREI